MPKNEVKNINRTRMFRNENNIWSITPVKGGGITIELCRPGEEELAHPEGNAIKVQISPESIFLSRDEEPDTCMTCGLDVPGPHPHGGGTTGGE